MSPNPSIRVALLGNPNTGKTTLFNLLAGLNHKTGNYPGVTVEVKKGKGVHGFESFEWVDLPGTYSLAARSPDELLAVELVLGRLPNEPRPDVLLCLADATNLDRTLYLVSQARELGLPIVVAVTMGDLAVAQGVLIDYPRIQANFKLPFVAINAFKGTGLQELKAALVSASKGNKPEHASPLPGEIVDAAEELTKDLGNGLPHPLAMRAILDEGGAAEVHLAMSFGEPAIAKIAKLRETLKKSGIALAVIEPRARYKDIRNRLKDAVSRPQFRKPTVSDRIDRWLVHPIWGLAMFLCVMFFLFQSIFVLARPLMDLVEGGIDGIKALLEGALPPGPFTSLILDGVVAGVGSVVVFLPQIIILFGFLSILEDCGYMARAAFLMDRVMSRFGLTGKSFIPLLSSLACAVPGILSTRVIENRRDRLATILVAPLMSCSARLPVYYLLTDAFFPDPWWAAGLVMFCMYLLGFLAAPMAAWAINGLVLRGDPSIFVLEMPPYRVPSVVIVARKMAEAGASFLYRAGTLILATMVIVWALLYFPSATPDGGSFPDQIQAASEEEKPAMLREWKEQSILGRAGKLFEQAFLPLGWDWRIGMSVLASFPAREVVVAALGVSFGDGEIGPDDQEGQRKLVENMMAATKADGTKLFTRASALSLLVFFSLCCQCSSTLVVIWRETKSLGWPLFTFGYMTGLAYFLAWVTYQVWIGVFG